MTAQEHRASCSPIQVHQLSTIASVLQLSVFYQGNPRREPTTLKPIDETCTSPLAEKNTVLNESDDIDILGVIFDSNMTIVNYLRSVSRPASQILGILMKFWRVFHDRFLLGRCFRGFVLPV